jgi:hypothetical protein
MEKEKDMCSFDKFFRAIAPEKIPLLLARLLSDPQKGKTLTQFDLLVMAGQD